MDKACSVTDTSVNVFPLLAAVQHDSQKEGVEVGKGEPGGLTAGFEPKRGRGARLTLSRARQNV